MNYLEARLAYRRALAKGDYSAAIAALEVAIDLCECPEAFPALEAEHRTVSEQMRKPFWAWLGIRRKEVSHG